MLGLGIVPANAGPSDYRLTSPATASLVSAEGDPIPLGQKAKLGDWEIVIHATDLNGTQKVLSENPLNRPPGPGRQFLISDISITNTGAKEEPLMYLLVGIVGKSQKVYQSFEEDSRCGVVPGKLDTFGDLNPGESAEGNICASIPIEEINGAVWKFEDIMDLRSSNSVLLSVQ
jgi:hypothetical protein